MTKMKSQKGFTLAELLVVIAILAILIAIAVPVFTHMVAEANLRVNQANVHSVRSAAVAHILTNLGEMDATKNPDVKLNSHIGDKDCGWVATAKVDNNGNISELQVYVIGDGSIKNTFEGIGLEAPTDNYYKSSGGDFFTISDDVSKPFATAKPSMGKSGGTPEVYYVQAVITDLDDTTD